MRDPLPDLRGFRPLRGFQVLLNAASDPAAGCGLCKLQSGILHHPMPITRGATRITKPFDQLIPVAVFALVLTGCQSSNSPASSTLAASATTHYAVPATTSPLMSVDPANVAKCDPGVVTTVKWNTQSADTAAAMIEVWVGASSTDIKLFAAGGAQGQAETRPWTHPGTHFVLKNKADGKVLADVTVSGPKCPPAGQKTATGQNFLRWPRLTALV